MIAGDLFGKIVRDLLRGEGIDDSAVAVSPDAETSQTLIVNVVGQDRRFIHTFGANARFHAADIPADRAAACKVLYLGGYLIMDRVTQDELIPVFAAARVHDALAVRDQRRRLRRPIGAMAKIGPSPPQSIGHCKRFTCPRCSLGRRRRSIFSPRSRASCRPRAGHRWRTGPSWQGSSCGSSARGNLSRGWNRTMRTEV